MATRTLPKMLLILGIMGTALFATAQAQAQTTTRVVVVAGDDTTLVESKQKIDVKSAPKKGGFRIETTGVNLETVGET